MLDFSRRDAQVAELMDDPACDLRLLFNTYRQFARINALLSGWRGVYRRHLRPALPRGRPVRLLDIGFGGGDVVRALARWARADGIDLRITAIDTDARALAFVRELEWPDTVSFQQASTGDLRASGRRYDAVISNAVLHHLDETAAAALLRDSRALAETVVVHNDLVRSAAAYTLFSTFVAPFFRDSFAATDGQRSIRRSWTVPEMRDLAGPGWTIRPLAPFRQLAVWQSSA